MSEEKNGSGKGKLLGAAAAAAAAAGAAAGKKKLDEKQAEQVEDLKAEVGLDRPAGAAPDASTDSTDASAAGSSDEASDSAGSAATDDGNDASDHEPDAGAAGGASGGGPDDGAPPTAEGDDDEQRSSHPLEKYLPTVKLTAAAFALAFLVGAVMIAFSDSRSTGSLSYFFTYPWDFFSYAGQAIWNSYSSLVSGAFGSWAAITDTLEQSAPLICAGLGISLAFRAGMFNIGAQGQLLTGAILAGYVGFTWHLPVGLHLLVALAAGLLGGAVWGGIVGLLKARTGAHEVIVTIMLNYVAMRLLDYLLTLDAFQRAGSDNPRSPVVDSNATLPQVFGLHSGLLLALLAAVGVWWLLERSTVGFEMRAVGANPEASSTAGINVSRTYIVAMALAGMLAGLAATQQVLGHQDPLAGDFSPTVGFDAITVALLGRATPFGTVLAGILFGAMTTGGTAMQASAAATPLSLTQLVQALIVLFVAAPALVKVVFRMKKVDSQATVLAKGWN